ncbi:MAG TPA: hypothetical protein VGD99_26640 [Anaerolineae bacterium]
MARRKRASLKDKGPETLGFTPKKGKGIDMLFGGPVEGSDADLLESDAASTDDADQPESEEAKTNPSTQTNAGLSGFAQRENNMALPPAPSIPGNAPEALPVNEADTASGVIVSSDEVDELGLPVAMEAPPSDLEFATMPTQSPADSSEQNTFDPSLSPFAAPPPPPPAAGVPPSSAASAPTGELAQDDLSGLLATDDLSGLAQADDLSGFGSQTPTSASPPPLNLPPAPTAPVGAPTFGSPTGAAGGDLSGFGADTDLSGLDAAPTASTFPPPASPATWPAPTAAPITSSIDMTLPSTSVPGVPAAGASSQVSPPPAPATPRHRLPDARVESLGGIITERIEVSERDLLPSDVNVDADPSSIINVRERAQVERDEAIAMEVARYIGKERRRALDDQIEALYDEVAKELSVITDDAEFALRTLSEAQDIILEDPRQYDEALYRVAVVKTMIARKRNLRRWSYTWGSFVFFYGLVWVIAFAVGFIATPTIREILGTGPGDVNAIRTAWFSALAGGIGGVIGIFYSLYWHVSMKQDFDRQYVMYYFVQPIMGFFLGAVIYFIFQGGFGAVGISGADAASNDVVVAIQVITGWVAGFRQRVVFEMIEKIVKSLSGGDKDEDDSKPVSLAPPGESI